MKGVIMKINAVNIYSYTNRHSIKNNQQLKQDNASTNSIAFQGKCADKIAKAGTMSIGAMAGGFIGFCLGGPIGAMIGGGIGAGAGSVAQECENDSMKNGDNSHYVNPEDERARL